LSFEAIGGRITAAMTPSPFAQADLFDDADEDHGPSLRQTWARQAPPKRRRLTRAFDPEGAAQILDEHDDYRVLRRLKPRPVDPAYRLAPGESIALVVDVETTGLDHRRDEIIELGMIAFVHDTEGRIGPVVGALSMLHEPTVEISAEITRLTGITAEMVAGQAIDMAVVRALLEPAEIVIAHNAKFDRAFCERLDESFRHKAWACSVAEVPWREIGFEGAKLGYLVNGCGLFHNGHRAVDDCHALLEVLAHEPGGGSGFAHLLRSSARTRVRVWAEWAPFDMKDVLKGRGYRWFGGGDGLPKAWWTEVDEDDLAAEMRFLEKEIYLREVELRRDVLTAYDRYRPA
jgi:DNA polymerase-3 subunit epsilon